MRVSRLLVVALGAALVISTGAAPAAQPAATASTGTAVAPSVADSSAADCSVGPATNVSYYCRVVDGGTVFLAVPDGVALIESPRSLLTMLGTAAELLDVGPHPDSITVEVRPNVWRGGNGGYARGTYIWITPGASNRMSGWGQGSENIWIHEYVHTRQNYTNGGGMKWFAEASASYYGGLLSIQQGRGDYDTFYRYVTSEGYNATVLAERSEWYGYGQYRKGARVLAALDAEIRTASGGNRTLQYVFRRVNTHDGPVSLDDFGRFASAAAGRPLDEWIMRYVTTNATPAVPDNPYLFVAANSSHDSDSDGLTDAAEMRARTHPFEADTDGDGTDDGEDGTPGRIGARPPERDTTPVSRSETAGVGVPGVPGFGVGVAGVSVLMALLWRRR